MTELFRGYVPTKNKKCMIPFKNKSSDELMTYKDVSGMDEYAGILSEDAILIDIDDSKQAEIAYAMVESADLRCRIYQTTRGMHFLFLNKSASGDVIQTTCKTHTPLICGLSADIKVGVKNSYEVLKYDGKERNIIYDILDGEDYEEVPKWLLPVSKGADFVGMSAGDGRNQALFNYILTLQGDGLSVEESRDVIRMINKFVLSDPLDESEIETILRDESFQKPSFFNKRGQFLFEKFAQYMVANNHIVKINNQLHIYENGVYVHGYKMIESEMIRLIPNLNRSKRAEVITYLELLVKESKVVADARYIAFKNGIYDISTGDFMDFSPDIVVTNKIDHNYNPAAYSQIADTTLDKFSCGDDGIRALLEELIGYTFYRRNELRKAFIMIGDKANGKSTYLDMITSLLGTDNTSALDLGELGDRFKTAELYGKLANIGDDIGDDFIPNPAVFKKLVSGDRLNAERKGYDPFDFNSYAKMLFSANNLPRIKDKSGAVVSRLIIIPFNATFTKDDPDFDPYIKYKLRTEEVMEYLILLGIEGLRRVLDNHAFTCNKSVEDQIREYEEQNNPILLFFKENPKIIGESTASVYREYAEFCRQNTLNAMGNIEFSKQVKRYYGCDVAVRRIDGRSHRVFVEV